MNCIFTPSWKSRNVHGFGRILPSKHTQTLQWGFPEIMFFPQLQPIYRTSRLIKVMISQRKFTQLLRLGWKRFWSSSWDQYTYPASHNHGLVENGCISNISFLSFRVIFHWTMIMSKKSPTGPSEQTLKPEYLRALSTSLVRSVGIRSHSVFDGLWEEG